MPGTLYIIATPIGNLDDSTSRMIETIRGVDVLFCEDTRVTRKLLTRFGIDARTESYREQVHDVRVKRIVGLLEEDRDVGYVSDAGTPGISDPGSRLVRDVIAGVPDAKVVPVPGPSAVTTALSVSGLPAERFVFLGFPPHKKGRDAFIRDAVDHRYTTVMYESPHRIGKLLSVMAEAVPERRIVVCRELTKLHETIERGSAAELAERLGAERPRGEYVIVIEGRPRQRKEGRP